MPETPCVLDSYQSPVLVSAPVLYLIERGPEPVLSLTRHVCTVRLRRNYSATGCPVSSLTAYAKEDTQPTLRYLRKH